VTGKPKYLKDFDALHRSDPQFSHIDELESELYANPSDRAVAVVFGSFVESALRSLLQKQFRPDLNSDDRGALFGFEGPMGPFSSKILMAYGMGLLGPTSRHDLDLIRHLRNGFAHSRIPFKFTTPEVRSVCDQFKIVELDATPIPHGYLNRVPHEQRQEATDRNHPKTRFITTCHHLSYRMMVKRDGPKAGDYVFPNDEPLP